jgi:hypothetical protein
MADPSLLAPLGACGVGWRGARAQVASRRATARLTHRVRQPAGGLQGPRRRWDRDAERDAIFLNEVFSTARDGVAESFNTTVAFIASNWCSLDTRLSGAPDRGAGTTITPFLPSVRWVPFWPRDGLCAAETRRAARGREGLDAPDLGRRASLSDQPPSQRSGSRSESLRSPRHRRRREPLAPPPTHRAAPLVAASPAPPTGPMADRDVGDANALPP